MTDKVVQFGESLLTCHEAAAFLGVSDRTIWTLVNQGQLLTVRFGRSVRIDPADLRTFIDRSKQPTAEIARNPHHEPKLSRSSE